VGCTAPPRRDGQRVAARRHGPAVMMILVMMILWMEALASGTRVPGLARVPGAANGEVAVNAGR